MTSSARLGTALSDPALAPDRLLRQVTPPDVESFEIDGEILVWERASASLHLLDPSASVVYRLMDGQSTLATTAKDLAEVLGLPFDEMLRDVCQCAAALRERGLLEDVG